MIERFAAQFTANIPLALSAIQQLSIDSANALAALSLYAFQDVVPSVDWRSLGVGGVLAAIVIYWKRIDDQRHQEALDDLKKAHSAQIETIRETHAKELQILNKQHEEDLEELIQRYQVDAATRSTVVERFAGAMEEIARVVQAMDIMQRYENRMSELERAIHQQSNVVS